MGSSSNFISAAVLDISRKATAVNQRADFIGRLHSCTQNPRLSSCKFYCKCMLAVLYMPCDCGAARVHCMTTYTGGQSCVAVRRYFQHAHFIPIVGVGKRGAYLLVHGDLPRQHSFGTTLRFTGPVPADPWQ